MKYWEPAMPNEHTEMLRNVFCDILERMAFMFGDLAEEEEMPDTMNNATAASMTFTGPIKGSLTLAVPSEMCPEIAANILGIDPEEERAVEASHDALKELLNVICGNVLTELAGVEPVFDLSVPEIRELDSAAWKALQENSATIALLVDDHPALLGLLCES